LKSTFKVKINAPAPQSGVAVGLKWSRFTLNSQAMYN
jgi:hypothetical protein